MNRVDVAKIVAFMFAQYPMARIEESTLRVYESQLIELDAQKLDAAVRRLTRTNKFPPSVAEVFEAYGVVENGRQLEPGEAYELVNDAVRRFGRYQPESAMRSLPERVRKTVASLGGFLMICDDTNETALRARFLDVYESLAKVDGDDQSARSKLLPEGNGGSAPPLLS